MPEILGAGAADPACPARGGSAPPPHFAPPSALCFRITRSCNARCSFCLAPPDGARPDYATLASWSDWLLERGTRRIDFCGGEPTIHPAFPRLLGHVAARGAKTALTTNALEIVPALPPLLRETSTCVRVSLHGERRHHDSLVGSGCFDRTTLNLRRLLAAGVRCSIQAIVVAGAGAELDWLIRFCLQQGVRRLGVLPFVARGAGWAHREALGLSDRERSSLRDFVHSERRRLGGQLDLRWLDLASKRVPVLEPDGRLVLEGASEGRDLLLCYLPALQRG
jgi:MoaA/NifB/PqqE/SkfB family radical SAM enzyme